MTKFSFNSKSYIIGAGSLFAISGNYFLPDYRKYNYNQPLKLNLMQRSWSVVGKTMADKILKETPEILEEHPEIFPLSNQKVGLDCSPFCCQSLEKTYKYAKFRFKLKFRKGRRNGKTNIELNRSRGSR